MLMEAAETIDRLREALSEFVPPDDSDLEDLTEIEGFHLGTCFRNGDTEPGGRGCVRDCPRRLHAEVRRLRDGIRRKAEHWERIRTAYSGHPRDEETTVSDSLAKARAIAAAATPGRWEHVEPPIDGTIHRVRCSGRWLLRMEDTGYTPGSSWEKRRADALHIARFDPTTVSAMLDAIEAADVVAHREDWTDPSWANPQMMADLDAALDRVCTLIGDDHE